MGLLRTAGDPTKIKEYYGDLLREFEYMSGGINIIIMMFSMVIFYSYENVFTGDKHVLFVLILSFTYAYDLVMGSSLASVISRLRHGYIEYLDDAYKLSMADKVVSAILEMAYLYVVSTINMWIAIILLCTILVIRTIMIFQIHKEKPRNSYHSH